MSNLQLKLLMSHSESRSSWSPLQTCFCLVFLLILDLILSVMYYIQSTGKIWMALPRYNKVFPESNDLHLTVITLIQVIIILYLDLLRLLTGFAVSNLYHTSSPQSLFSTEMWESSSKISNTSCHMCSSPYCGFSLL